jgi:hypothetical protein
MIVHWNLNKNEFGISYGSNWSRILSFSFGFWLNHNFSYDFELKKKLRQCRYLVFGLRIGIGQHFKRLENPYDQDKSFLTGVHKNQYLNLPYHGV